MSKNNSVPGGTPSPQEDKFAKIGFEISALIDKVYSPATSNAEVKRIILNKYLSLARCLIQGDSIYNISVVTRIVEIINGD